MCGRFVVFSNLEELQAHFQINRVETEVSASYNVAPTQQVLSVIRKNDQNVLVRLVLTPKMLPYLGYYASKWQ